MCSHLPIDKDRFHFSDSWNDNAAQNLCKYITEQQGINGTEPFRVFLLVLQGGVHLGTDPIR